MPFKDLIWMLNMSPENKGVSGWSSIFRMYRWHKSPWDWRSQVEWILFQKRRGLRTDPRVPQCLTIREIRRHQLRGWEGTGRVVGGKPVFSLMKDVSHGRGKDWLCQMLLIRLSTDHCIQQHGSLMTLVRTVSVAWGGQKSYWVGPKGVWMERK